MTASYKIYPAEPMGKPRMTRGDRITMSKIKNRRRLNPKEQKRASVLSRWMACETEYQVRNIKINLDHYYHLIFVLPMPASWSTEKRQAHLCQPHQAKPDKDNLEKGMLDALFGEDMAAWNGHVTKVWGYSGRVIVSTEPLPVDPKSLFILLETVT